MNATCILPLADPTATLLTVGGKGLSLARLSQAGYPVPTGFHITTDAYRQYVQINGLDHHIQTALRQVDALDPKALEAASTRITRLFLDGEMSEELAASIVEAYQSLTPHAECAVAVRSSATAEDLPEASFAGQQESYLNIRGETAVLTAVKKCWASLWTARAIAYRFKNNINQEMIALAVVVQEMVPAQAAGILFTANPVNGRRTEIVINATWGLGESIVGGLVTPDTIIAEKASGTIKKMDVAEKTVITVPTGTGTVEKPLTGDRRKAPVLNKDQVIELARMARQVEAFYGSPQDIEWCLAGSQFFIVQSRPVTTLPAQDIPLPSAWKLPKGNYAAMRNNIVELMAEPLSPLFATLGLSAINRSLNHFMDESFAMRGIMPPEIIVVVNHYAYNNGSVSLKSMGRLVFGAGKIMKKMFSGAVERWTETGRPRYYQTVASWQAKDWRSFTSIQLVESVDQLLEAAVDAYAALISGVIPAAWMTEAIFTRVYDRMIKRAGDPPAPVYLLGYDSLPIQADQALYRLSQWVREDPALLKYLDQTAASHLVKEMEAAIPPAGVPASTWNEFLLRFQEHLRRFGHTLYDLDFAHPVPADDPAPVFEALKLYLRGEGADPLARQKESAERRERAKQAIRNRLTGRRLKWFNKYLRSAQKYAPLREDGLAEIGLAYPLIRQMLRELGSRVAAQGAIPAADDIFWMTQAEVMDTAARLDAGLLVDTFADTIRQRKLELQAARHANPPMALPQMKVFGFDLMSLKAKRGRGGKGNAIKGVAASPGRVTGIARVLHGPEDFDEMKSGEVLVAPITTPAWTPLFIRAAAIVTDVGGPLSHGSIVAREYGIPAVLGTSVATRRIHSGQTITVDGSTGLVTLEKNGRPGPGK